MNSEHDENFEAAKLFWALSKALNEGNVSLAVIDAAKSIMADGIEQESFVLYTRCKIENDYPMEEYIAQAEIELKGTYEPHNENSGVNVGGAPPYPH